jgi:hypothetical protein
MSLGGGGGRRNHRLLLTVAGGLTSYIVLSDIALSAMAECTVATNLFRLFMLKDSETPRLHGYILAEVTVQGYVEDSIQVCV